MTQVLVPLTDGFEELEAISIIDVLRRAGIDVTTAAIGGSLHVTGSHQITVKADVSFADVQATTFDAVILPGGPGYKTLLGHGALHQVLRRHAEAGKVTAAICAAPAVLAAAGVLGGKAAACYPSVEADVKAAAGSLRQDAVVADGQVITSRGPATALAFALSLVEKLAGAEKRRQVAGDMLAA